MRSVSIFSRLFASRWVSKEKRSRPRAKVFPRKHTAPPRPSLSIGIDPVFPPLFPPTLNLFKEEEEYRKSISHREEITISTLMALPRQSIEIYIFLSFQKYKTKRKQLLWFKFPAISELAIGEFLFGGKQKEQPRRRRRRNGKKICFFFLFSLLFGPAEKKKKKTENKRWETSSFINHSRTIFFL